MISTKLTHSSKFVDSAAILSASIIVYLRSQAGGRFQTLSCTLSLKASSSTYHRFDNCLFLVKNNCSSFLRSRYSSIVNRHGVRFCQAFLSLTNYSPRLPYDHYVTSQLRIRGFFGGIKKSGYVEHREEWLSWCKIYDWWTILQRKIHAGFWKLITLNRSPLPGAG